MKKLLPVLRYALFMGLGIGLLYFAFKDQDFGTLKQNIRDANYFWIGMSLLAGAIAYWSRAARWKLLLEPLGYRPSITNTLISLMVGYIANLALPRLGEVLRCTLLNRLEKVPIEACLGTVVAERVFDLIMLIILISTTILVESDMLRDFIFGIFSSKVEGGAEAASSATLYWILGGMVVLGLILLWALIKYQHYLHRYKLYVKATTFLKGIGKGLLSVKNLKHPWLFVMHTLIIWFMYFNITFMAFFALAETANLSWKASLSTTVIGGLGMSAPVQGGIGVFHILVSQGLKLYGLTEAAGLSIATILHGSQTIFVIIVGGICLLWSIARVKTNKANADLGQNL